MGKKGEFTLREPGPQAAGIEHLPPIVRDEEDAALWAALEALAAGDEQARKYKILRDKPEDEDPPDRAPLPGERRVR